MIAPFWGRRVEFCLQVQAQHMCIPKDQNGTQVRAYVYQLTRDGCATEMGGLVSTSNHIAPNNLDGIVRLLTDKPVYWTVELRGST